LTNAIDSGEFVERLREGRQAFVVCPLVEVSEKLPGKAAGEEAERLRRGPLRDFQVGLLHGCFPSAYSQNAVAGTMQRFFSDSQPRQCGLEMLRMFVTGRPPYWTGPGIPQRASTSSLLPSSAFRTIGAIWSGKIAAISTAS